MISSLVERLQLRGRVEYFLFLSAINLMLVNFIMSRHATIAFDETETARTLFALAFFAGISLGYALSDRASLVTIRRLLPVFLIAQMAMILLVPSFYHVFSRDIGAWATEHDLPANTGKWAGGAAVFVLVAVAVSAPYAVFLPLIIQSQEKNLKRYLSIAIAGAIVGLLCVPLLSVLPYVYLLAGYFLTYVGVSVSLRSSRWVSVGLTILVVFYVVNFEEWDSVTSSWFYHRQSGAAVQGVLYTRYSPHQKIEVLALEGGPPTLALNGKRRPLASDDYFVAELPTRLLGNPNVCVLGGDSVSAVERIGAAAASIHIVDSDAVLFETSRAYFTSVNYERDERQHRLDEQKNWSLVVDDAKHFLASDGNHFGLIVHRLPRARSRQLALMYTAEFFSLAKARLAPSGVFAISCPTPFDAKSAYGRRLIATLAHIFDRYFILMHDHSAYFYGGNLEMSLGDGASLLEAIQHPDKETLRFLTSEEIDKLLKETPIITNHNVGDLLYG